MTRRKKSFGPFADVVAQYHAAVEENARRQALEHFQRGPVRPPPPRFQLGDEVSIQGVGVGRISWIGGYDDLLGQYRYKVLQPNGTRLYHNENSLRLRHTGHARTR